MRKYQTDPSTRHGLWKIATREWAQKHLGYVGRQGGWIYDRGGRPVTQGWWFIWHGYQGAILDDLTRRLTAFDTFDEMVKTNPRYRPTIFEITWRYVFLADQYDSAQRDRNDPRRAFRGSRYEEARRG